MVPGGEVFAESIGILPLLHAPLRPLRGLVVGKHGSPLGAVLLRYPDTVGVAYFQSTPPNHGKARQVPSLSLLDAPVDVAAVAVEGSPIESAGAVRQCMAPDGVAVVATSDFRRAYETLGGLKRIFPYVAPMRVYLPERCALFLCSAVPARKTRACPEWSRHLSDQFVPTLFTFSKDEYRAIFQGVQ